MTISATYDLLTAKSRSKWGILYYVVGHKGDLPTNIQQLLADQLPEFDLSAPVAYTTVPASESPIEALDSAWVTFIKWPICLKKGAFTDELESNLQQRIRQNVNRALIEQEFELLQMDIEPIGSPLTGDHGLPVTPAVPPVDVKLWPAALASVLALPIMRMLNK